MAPKRKAREAFGGPMSAFAAAQKGKTRKAVPGELPEETLAAAVAGAPWDCPPNEGVVDEITRASVPDRLQQHRTIAKLSDFDRRKVEQIRNGLEVNLDIDQSITIIGEFDIRVLSGVVSVHGAMLHNNSGSKRVYALSSHALPPLIAKKTNTRLRITSTQSGIQDLGKYSPLFRSLGSGNDSSSFTVLRTTTDDPLHRPLPQLEVDEDTRKVLSRINARLETRETPRIIVIGAKSTGKSTLNRTLCNMIITRPGSSHCLYLDLDPGQPEFGPPGQVSLVEVAAPLLGPAYTHPASDRASDYRLLCSHTIAATSFKDDPDHYASCALDLCRRLPRDVPVIVNTTGWVNGLGAIVLISLLPHLKVTDAVILDSVEETLPGKLDSTCVLHQIPRRQLKPTSSRTPAELRAMQTMAYFHRGYDTKGSVSWTDLPIHEMRPWMVSYQSGRPGIAAILSYGQAPQPDFLSEVLDGALVAIVLPHLVNSEAVQRTQNENLPYIVDSSSGCSLPLNPAQSIFIGLALVRGVEHTEQRIHLVTPLLDHEIAALLDKHVVLVRGGHGCPEWAYLEDLYLSDARRKKDEGISIDADDERPWVSKREPHVGVEGAVWRLRHPPMKDAVK